MSRWYALPVSRLGFLPVRHRAFLAPLRPWNQRLLAGAVAAHPLGNAAQLVGSLPGYRFIGHKSVRYYTCDICGAGLDTGPGSRLVGVATLPTPRAGFRPFVRITGGEALALAPHMLPIEGDNPTLRDSWMGVKKNQFILPVLLPTAYSRDFFGIRPGNPSHRTASTVVQL